MITVSEANRIINEHILDFGTEEISLEDSVGRILREPIVADRDFPPYNRITMDGIAIRFENYKAGQKVFLIDGVVAAGTQMQKVKETDICMEVMTGAMMPAGLDTVIPYEQIQIKNGNATLGTKILSKQQNIHFQGSDRKVGELIIRVGTTIGSPEVGVGATVGKAKIEVSRLPKTIIISSGDELVDVVESPLPHQIRKSNLYRIKTILKNFGIDADTAHILDDYDQVVSKLSDYLESYELFILSGGVSKGKFDFLPKALDELGVQKHFHKIQQRPGKPFWFGSRKQVTFFAFPGNPVSSFMCMQQYFIPWLNACLQAQPKPRPMGVLTAEVEFKPDLTYFLEVKVSYSQKGEILATPVKGNGSGDLANLVDADAFIQLPQERSKFLKGEAFPLTFYR